MQVTPENWIERLEVFAQACTERQESLLVEQQGQLASLQTRLEQQVSQAVTAAPPSPHILQLHKLVRCCCKASQNEAQPDLPFVPSGHICDCLDVDYADIVSNSQALHELLP